MITTLRTIAVSLLAVLAGFSFATAASAETIFYLADDAVTLDGVISDEEWGEATINDGEDNPDREQFCWNTNTQDWDGTSNAEDCTTYVYDPEGMMDIEIGWFRANETNMLLALEMASPMMAIIDVQDETALSIYSEELAFAGIDHLPNNEAFDGKMVFAFSTDTREIEEGEWVEKDIEYDWYVVASLGFNLPLSEEMDDAGFLTIYEESGDTNGFQEAEDIAAGELDPTNSESSMGDSGTESAVFEIKQNIENFYAVTQANEDSSDDMQSGQEVTFRLESFVQDSEVTVSASETGATEGVTVRFDDSAGVTEDGLVVGAGAKKKKFNKNGTPNAFAESNVTVYTDEEDGSEQLSVVPWSNKNDKPTKVGNQVAVGDVDADGEHEIVVVPFKKQAIPRIKVYDLEGNLEFSSKVHKKKARGITKKAKQKLKKKAKKNLTGYTVSGVNDELGKNKNKRLLRRKRYNLAVGDVDGDSRDDIVLTAATGRHLFMDVLRLTEDGLTRTNQFQDSERDGYIHGAWVSVADVTGNGIDNIVTSPMRGDSLVELWSISTDGNNLELLDWYQFTTDDAYRGGGHIAATDGSILAVQHDKTGKVRELEWNSSSELLQTTDVSFEVGRIGNVYYDGTNVFYSPWKAMTVKKTDLEGNVEYTLDVESRGAFLDYVSVD